MRALIPLLLVGCAPAIATIQQVDPANAPDETEAPAVEESAQWRAVRLATALDRILLRGERDESCLQLTLVSPASWPSEYPVDVSRPWALEFGVWMEEPCPDDIWEPHTGTPLLPDALEGSIDIEEDRENLAIRMDLAIDAFGTAWEEQTEIDVEF